MRQHTLATTTSSGTQTPWQFRHLFRRLSNAGSAFQDRLSGLIARSWIQEIRRPSTSTERQRFHELAKKTIPLKSVLLVALFEYEPSHSSNTRFMMSLQACILSFLTDILSAVTLINLTTTVPVCWHCFLACFSGVSMTLVPYFLLVSMDKLSAYVILAVPLPVTVVALVNCVWAREVDDDTLDHVFDVSSAVTNVAAGGGLTGTIFGYNMMSSQQPVVITAPGPLGFLLFFTISLGVYLMLVATVRPKALTRHTQHLIGILLLLLGATALVAAVEFVGWWLACTAASIDVIEAAVSAVLAKVVHDAATTWDEVDAAGRKNEQRLTSIVIATVFFTLVMQLHSQKATAIAGDSPGQYEVLRMLLYFAAFLWSFNRMLFFHEESSASGDGGGAAGVWAWLWSVIQLVRTIVVVLAVLDHVYYNYFLPG